MSTSNGYGAEVVSVVCGEFGDEGAVPRLQRAGRGGLTFPEAGYNRAGSLSASTNVHPPSISANTSEYATKVWELSFHRLQGSEVGTRYSDRRHTCGPCHIEPPHSNAG